MARNRALDFLKSTNQLAGAANQFSSLYSEINNAQGNQQLRKAQLVAQQRINEVQEEITADPDFYKNVDQLYEENDNQPFANVHPHAFDEKYEYWWTGGVQDDYWKTSNKSGATGRSQEIFEEISEKYLTNDQAKQEFELWYMEASEQVRSGLTELGYKRKAERLVFDLQDTLNNKLLQMDNDRYAINAAQSQIDEAVGQGIISRADGQKYFNEFKDQKIYNSAKDNAIDIMQNEGFNAARKFALNNSLPLSEESRDDLLEFVGDQYKNWDKAVRADVNRAESDFINLFASDGLRMEHVLGDKRLRNGHDYSNDVKEKWVRKIKASNDAGKNGEMDPNEVNDPETESEIYDLYIDPYVTPGEFKKEVSERIGSDEQGNPMLSNKRGKYWIDHADDKNVSTAFTEGVDMINEFYKDLEGETDDVKEIDQLRQRKLDTKKQLQDWIADTENKELLENKEVILQQVAGNLIREKIQLSIDPNFGYHEFKQKQKFDSMNLNDVERMIRGVQRGRYYGIEHKYGGEFLRLEEGLKKLGGELFEKSFITSRQKGGHIPLFFPDQDGTNGNYTDNYYIENQNRKGIIVEFFEEKNDLVPKVYHPELDQWRDIPQEMWFWLKPEIEKKALTNEQRLEKVEQYGLGNVMGGSR